MSCWAPCPCWSAWRCSASLRGASVAESRGVTVLDTSTGASTALIQTGGPVGGVRGQLDLRRILTTLGGQVLVRPEVFIGNAASKFSPDGKLTDDTTRKFLTDQMVALQDLVARVKRANG